MIGLRSAIKSINRCSSVLSCLRLDSRTSIVVATSRLHQLFAVDPQKLISSRSQKSSSVNYQSIRGKKGRGKRAAARDESDDESDSDQDPDDSDKEDSDDILGGDYQEKSADVNSMRFDVVAKAS
jgi:hypothetical protein